MSEPFLGEIRIVPYNFAPRGFAACNGQIMAIAQNTALFSLLGTAYGGNGVTTFGLPDLRGREAVGYGQLPGGGMYDRGQLGGVPSVTLNVNQMPSHSHQAFGRLGSDSGTPSDDATWGTSTTTIYGTQVPGSPMTGVTTGFMAPDSLLTSGGNQPHDNQAPYLGLMFVIALGGIFPPRN